MNSLVINATATGWTATALGPWAAAIVALFGAARLQLAGVHAGAPVQHVVACLESVFPTDVTITVEE